MKDLEEKVLDLMKELAPTSLEKLGLSYLYSDMKKNDATEEEIVRALLSGTLDGLRYGSWPK